LLIASVIHELNPLDELDINLLRNLSSIEGH
jgi:hypothetical protein